MKRQKKEQNRSSYSVSKCVFAKLKNVGHNYSRYITLSNVKRDKEHRSAAAW